MNDDAVIKEVRDARRRVAETYGPSVREIGEAIMREQQGVECRRPIARERAARRSGRDTEGR